MTPRVVYCGLFGVWCLGLHVHVHVPKPKRKKQKQRDIAPPATATATATRALPIVQWLPIIKHQAPTPKSKEHKEGQERRRRPRSAYLHPISKPTTHQTPAWAMGRMFVFVFVARCSMLGCSMSHATVMRQHAIRQRGFGPRVTTFRQHAIWPHGILNEFH